MNTERKIQDYLHLYLGCDAQIAVIVPGQELSWEPDKLNIRWLHGSLNKLVEVKPILRPLSDMTEEEIDWWWKYMRKLPNEELEEAVWTTELNGEPCEPHWTLWSKTRTMGARCGYTLDIFGKFEPDDFLWLLKNHFDLFHLIPSGLAIDSTTL